MTDQIAELQNGQAALQESLQQQRMSPPVRASQIPVSQAVQGVSNFAKMVGQPPKTKPLPCGLPGPPMVTSGLDGNVPPQTFAEETSPAHQTDPFARAMLEQSNALMTLVAQMHQGGDPLLDGQPSSSSGSLGTRGSVGRERLQKELSPKSGAFLLAVLQNAAKRLRPASPKPQSIEEISGADFSMIPYLERFVLHDSLSGTIRRLCAVQRTGADPLCSCAHSRCSCPFGPQWSHRLSRPAHGGSRSGEFGWQQMGIGLQDDAIGGAAVAVVGLSQPELRPPVKKFLLSGSSAMDHRCFGLFQRDRLHPDKASRGHSSKSRQPSSAYIDSWS